MLEIEGNPDGIYFMGAKPGCPISGEQNVKSPLCPKFKECEIFIIWVRTGDFDEANFYAAYAVETGNVPKCLRGKPYLLKMFGQIVNFHFMEIA